ncbi:hypothetical protein [Streptomyces nondiastaticus]|uniref:Uncharacterized protein n=1 Tax=Streptomyces nondiastaticus TaxID=3154512 RepID=A0ABW6U4G2_9ACTN
MRGFKTLTAGALTAAAIATAGILAPTASAATDDGLKTPLSCITAKRTWNWWVPAVEITNTCTGDAAKKYDVKVKWQSTPGHYYMGSCQTVAPQQTVKTNGGIDTDSSVAVEFC